MPYFSSLIILNHAVAPVDCLLTKFRVEIIRRFTCDIKLHMPWICSNIYNQHTTIISFTQQRMMVLVMEVLFVKQKRTWQGYEKTCVLPSIQMCCSKNIDAVALMCVCVCSATKMCLFNIHFIFLNGCIAAWIFNTNNAILLACCSIMLIRHIYIYIYIYIYISIHSSQHPFFTFSHY